MCFSFVLLGYIEQLQVRFGPSWPKQAKTHMPMPSNVNVALVPPPGLGDGKRQDRLSQVSLAIFGLLVQ